MNSIDLLHEMGHLMKLKGENPFKIRAFEKASHSLADYTDLALRAREGTLTDIPGVGKGIAEVLSELLLKGTTSALDDLRASLPAGLIEFTHVPGLGPKKAMAVIEALGIHTLSELEYACRENRLTNLKGFGEKIQKKVIEGLAFMKSNQDRQLLSDAFEVAQKLLSEFLAVSGSRRVSETGALRRRLETLSETEFMIELPVSRAEHALFKLSCEAALKDFQSRARTCLPVVLHFSSSEDFGYELDARLEPQSIGRLWELRTILRQSAKRPFSVTWIFHSYRLKQEKRVRKLA